jgi:hypothetical protein
MNFIALSGDTKPGFVAINSVRISAMRLSEITGETDLSQRSIMWEW